jgi:histidinol-phosphatase (PHP family)
MIKVNYHIHTTGSDGKHSPEQAVQAAISAGLTHICFTDHFIRPIENSWSKGFISKKYLKEVEEVRKKYKDKINISFGIEVDWLDGYSKRIKKQLSKHDFDFIIGSVHMIQKQEKNHFLVNCDYNCFLEKIKKYGTHEVIKEYYSQVRKLARSRICDSIGHLDVIKTYNNNCSLFKEDSFYKKEVLKTLDEIKKNNLCIEINTSGKIYDCNEFFPNFWILKEANKRKIPITIGTDAHWPERISEGINESCALAKKAGYKSIMIFKKRKAIEVKI